MARHPSDPAQKRCPVCRFGHLVVIAYDEPVTSADPELQQSANSHQIETYSCGHRVVGPSLATADPERLDVERRDSDETVDPLPEE